ncbi:unnamed protein product [Heterobilharzia americana]|nr:unnamed protein product [Heterobilharzia americana]CAH8600828.1 unnamed protein product [Heterobilharzia americana]
MNINTGFYVPFGVVTAFWFLVAILGPIFVPKGPNKMLLSVSVVLTAACCYLFWVGFYLAQTHPFFGPSLRSETVRIIQQQWTRK